MMKINREIYLENKIKKLEERLFKRDKKILDQQKEILELKKKIRSQNKQIEKFVFENKRKNDLLLINAYEEYYSKSEKTKDILVKARRVKSIEESSKKKRGRKEGRVNHKELANVKPDKVITLPPQEIENEIKKGECIYIGEDVCYKIVKKPCEYILIKIVRPKYKYNNKIYQALSDSVFGKAIITPSFVANALYLKYCLCTPINKLSKFIRNQYNIIISNQSWCDYFKKTSELLNPLYKRIEKEFVNPVSKVIHLDETELSLSKSKNRKENKRKRFYLLCGSSTYYDHIIKYYHYLGERKIDNEHISWLSYYKGTIVCDDYSGYKESDNIKIQNCWVHARRYISDVVKIHHSKVEQPQEKLLIEINKLFEIEREIEDKSLDEIKAIRNEKSKPVLANIKEICLKNKKSKIDKFKTGINYILKNFTQLTRFLSDPLIPIHNNAAERTVGSFVRARKNFQTMASEESAKVNAALFTIAITAEANGLKVEDYLCYVIEEIYKGEDVENLLPWSEKIFEKFKLEGLKLEE